MEIQSGKSRRQFLETSSLAVAGSLAALAAPRNVHAAGSDDLKVGLIGCGGRGTGAASQALKADPNVKLWAMADAFEDRLELEPEQPAKDRRSRSPRSTWPRNGSSSASTPTRR